MGNKTHERMRSSRAKALDKRKDVRVPIRLKVNFEISNRHYLFEYSSNLSQSGIFIHTMEPLQPGTEVAIQFSLPDDFEISTRGEVIWVNTEEDEEPGMGVRFVGLSDQAREKILAAVKKLAIL